MNFDPATRAAMAATADLLEKLLEQQKAGPAEGSGYTLPRMIEVALWDRCDAGGESVDAFEFEDGEVEVVIALIRQALGESAAPSERGAQEELEKLRGLVNTPEIDLFLRAVHLEAVHQVERWGTTDDRAKRPADWFWLVGYLSGKALHAANSESLPRYRHKKRGGTYEVISVGEDENNRGKSLIVYRGEDDGKIWVRPADQFFDGRFEELPSKPQEKALHHCISTAAALYNWHCAIKGTDVRMCPGSSDVERIVEAAFSGTTGGETAK